MAYQQEQLNMFGHFRARGYSGKTIKVAADKASARDRNSLLVPKIQINEQQEVRLITTFSRAS